MVTAPKQGDRVRVTFEGVVNSVGRPVVVHSDDNKVRAYVTPDVCEVIAKPVEPGDEVTLDVLNRLGDGAIIRARDGHAWQLTVDPHRGRIWRRVGLNAWTFYPSHAVASCGGTVLYVGEVTA